MTWTRGLWAAAACALVIAAPARAAEAPVAFSDGWVREAPPTATVMGGYVTIRNTSDHEIVLQGVSSPGFKEVQMHVTTHEGGKTGMRQVKQFKIPAGQVLSLKPGGAHLMLMQPKQRFKAGDRIALGFDFGKDGVVTHALPVHKAADRKGHHEHKGHHHDHGDHKDHHDHGATGAEHPEHGHHH